VTVFPGNWESKAAKVKSIKRRRRQTDHELDFAPIIPPTDGQAFAVSRITCGASRDADEARMFLDQLGILRQVRGEPDPDRYLAQCFDDLRRPRHADGSMAEPTEPKVTVPKPSSVHLSANLE
jgi:hypothetical protein